MTNKDFWDKIKTDYPQAFEHFSKWIDEYKKQAEWGKYFLPDVKFHDLPFELQNGIVARYDIEICVGKDHYILNLPTYADQFKSLFLEQQFLMQHNKKREV